jgi:hypothetical protein
MVINAAIPEQEQRNLCLPEQILLRKKERKERKTQRVT